MPGPCMCGDLYCSSCGPAQGNGKCPACGRWTADGGCVDPAACQKVNDAEADSYAREMAETDRLIADYNDETDRLLAAGSLTTNEAFERRIGRR